LLRTVRSHRALALLAGLVLVAIAVLAVVLTRASKSPAPSAERALRRPGLESIFEAEPQLHAQPGATLDLLRRLGVGTVRVYMAWAALAPDATSSKRPTGFDGSTPAGYPTASWAPYDVIIRDAVARGIGVLLDPGAPAPQWATGRGAPRGGVFGAWKPSAAQYGRFVHAVATRYSGHYTPPGASSPLPRVSFWSIWNEPNLGIDLAPEAIDNSTVATSPLMYRRLADAAWNALHRTGHGGDRILIGELAPAGQTSGKNVPGNFGYMVPLRFVRGLYCVDSRLQRLQGSAARARGCPSGGAGSRRFASDHPVLFQASGYAVHPYPGTGSVAPNVLVPDEPDFANLAALPKLEHVLDAVTSAYGSSKRFELYSTEYGYFTNPPSPTGAPLQLAAAYLNWAEYISWSSPRIRSWDQYLLADPAAGGASKFVTGLEFANGVHKPSYAAYRMPIYLPVTRVSATHDVEVWGCVRPARYARLDTGLPQRVQIELQPRPGAPFETLETLTITDPNGYFDTRVRFPSSGAVRTAWAYRHGPTVYSRTVPITAN
jgi:hypothetical protein